MPIITKIDDTDNDSAKSFTVPAGLIWRPLAVFVDYAATATAGNRVLEVQFKDDSDVILSRIPISELITANDDKLCTWVMGGAAVNVGIGDLLIAPLPVDMVLLPAWTIHVLDSAAVAAAADDMKVRLVIAEGRKP